MILKWLDKASKPRYSLDLGAAKKTSSEDEFAGLYELEVASLREAQFLVTRIGLLPLDNQGLIHIKEGNRYVHHPTLAEIDQLKVSLVVEEGGDQITLKEEGFLFPSGGKREAARCPTCGCTRSG